MTILSPNNLTVRGEKTRRKRERKTLMAALRGQNGAIDLASIMVGVLVIGIVGGVIAATVFAVVPWSQDQAAQADLGQVRQAEGIYAAAHAGGFADLATLQGPSSFAGGGGAPGRPGASISAAGTPLLPATDPARQLKINANANGFVAAEISQTGRTFYATSLNTTVSSTVPTVVPAGLSAPAFAVAAPANQINSVSPSCNRSAGSIALNWAAPSNAGTSTVTYRVVDAVNNTIVIKAYQPGLSTSLVAADVSGSSGSIVIQATETTNGTTSGSAPIVVYASGILRCP